MNYDEKLAQLVRATYKKTIAGTIPWTLTGTDRNGNEIFSASVGEKTIQLSKLEYVDSDGDPISDIELSVFDDVTNRKLESVRDSALTSISLGIPGFSGWYSLMDELYESSRRKTTGAEDAINELLAALDDDDPI